MAPDVSLRPVEFPTVVEGPAGGQAGDRDGRHLGAVGDSLLRALVPPRPATCVARVGANLQEAHLIEANPQKADLSKANVDGEGDGRYDVGGWIRLAGGRNDPRGQ